MRKLRSPVLVFVALGILSACDNRPAPVSPKGHISGADREKDKPTPSPTPDQPKGEDSKNSPGPKVSAPMTAPKPGPDPVPSPNPNPNPNPNPGPTPAPKPNPETAPNKEEAMDKACRPTEVEYAGEGSQGGNIFKQTFPNPEETFKNIALWACRALYKNPSEVRKDLKFRLWVHNYNGIAQAGGNQLEISTRYIEDFARNVNNDAGRIKLEFEGVLVHEIVHLYQNDKNFPGYFVEGIADLIRIKADKYEPGRKQKGGSYKDAYTTTAYFLKYLDEKFPDFGYKMNLIAGTNWPGDGWFRDQTGKSVDELWDEYQNSF